MSCIIIFRRDKEDLPPAYNEVTPARNPYFQPTPSSYTPGGGGGDSHRVRPEGATSGHDALDSSSPSGCYMLNNLSNLSFQSYPNSPGMLTNYAHVIIFFSA